MQRSLVWVRVKTSPVSTFALPMVACTRCRVRASCTRSSSSRARRRSSRPWWPTPWTRRSRSRPCRRPTLGWASTPSGPPARGQPNRAKPPHQRRHRRHHDGRGAVADIHDRAGGGVHQRLCRRDQHRALRGGRRERIAHAHRRQSGHGRRLSRRPRQPRRYRQRRGRGWPAGHRQHGGRRWLRHRRRSDATATGLLAVRIGEDATSSLYVIDLATGAAAPPPASPTRRSVAVRHCATSPSRPTRSSRRPPEPTTARRGNRSGSSIPTMPRGSGGESSVDVTEARPGLAPALLRPAHDPDRLIALVRHHVAELGPVPTRSMLV